MLAHAPKNLRAMRLPLCYSDTPMSYYCSSVTARTRPARGTRQLLPRLRACARAVRAAPAPAPAPITLTTVQPVRARAPVPPSAQLRAPLWMPLRRRVNVARWG